MFLYHQIKILIFKQDNLELLILIQFQQLYFDLLLEKIIPMLKTFLIKLD